MRREGGVRPFCPNPAPRANEVNPFGSRQLQSRATSSCRVRGQESCYVRLDPGRVGDCGGSDDAGEGVIWASVRAEKSEDGLQEWVG
jgi:hypothetical protein